MVDYPPAVIRESTARRDVWFQSYVTTVLRTDIRDLANITDTTAVPRLLSVVAAHAGGLLNFADLSRTMALPQTTLERYFARLEATFLVQLQRSCGEKPGTASNPDSQGLPERYWAIGASAGSHGGPLEE
jgi:predicted AAA+ superfamily ATPase